MASVLITGSGAREHALGWYIAQSPHVEETYFAGGNAGTAEIGANLPIDPTDAAGIARFVTQHSIDFIIPSTDESLEAGVVDALHKVAPAFGPTQAAAQLEWDKVFANEFAERHNIPHPCGMAFKKPDEAMRYVMDRGAENIVIKARGLAAGKGVSVPKNSAAAREFLEHSMMRGAFGPAGKEVLIQDRIGGKEVSVFAICGDEDYRLLPFCQDYKKLYDGDEGPNTGGMGAVAPAAGLLSKKALTVVNEKIIQPTLSGMKDEGRTFRGILYLGLMVEDDEPRLIEYNVRFGDPDGAPALLPLLGGDLFEHLYLASRGEVPDIPFNNAASAVITLATKNYPYGPSEPQPIQGLDKSYENVRIFHGGTTHSGSAVNASGGRALSVVAVNETIETALEDGYRAIGPDGVDFGGMQYRKDIGSNL